MRLRLRILTRLSSDPGPGPPTLGPAQSTGHSLVTAALSTFLSLSSFTPTPHKCEKCEVKSNCSSQQQMKLEVVIYFVNIFRENDEINECHKRIFIFGWVRLFQELAAENN